MELSSVGLSRIKHFIPVLLVICVLACTSGSGQNTIYLGSDLSFVNQLEDCGAEYRENGVLADPFELFAKHGGNTVRVRLWHSPQWTSYSNLTDVKRTMKRAKESGAGILLDFHYSDKWADPDHQYIPKAWENIENLDILSDSVFNYTTYVLTALEKEQLVPDIVQVGNEINIEVMQPADRHTVNLINWERNIKLLNSGLSAVQAFNEKHDVHIETMLHIAQPENAPWWFAKAKQHSVIDYDWIGLSYYPEWSEMNVSELGQTIDSLVTTFQKEVMVVETAYIHSLNESDSAHNILKEHSLLTGYAATPQGQLDYMTDLTATVLANGGRGVIYWEAAWVSGANRCLAKGNKGSHWENATFFDETNGNELLPAIEFMTKPYLRHK